MLSLLDIMIEFLTFAGLSVCLCVRSVAEKFESWGSVGLGEVGLGEVGRLIRFK